MKRFLQLIAILCLTNFSVYGQCPTQAGVVLDHTDVTCNGANDGIIDLLLTDGSPSFNFELYDLGSGNFMTPFVTKTLNSDGSGVVFSDIPTGAYNIYVYKPGCNGGFPALVVSDGPFGIVINEPEILEATATTLPDCDNNGTGSIDLTVNGGTPPYSYSWSGGLPAQEDHAGTAPAGTYSVDVEDANGCLVTVNNIKVSPGSEGGALSPLSIEVCSGDNGGTFNLSGYTGDIIRWETSIDNFGTDITDIGNAGSAAYTFTDLTQTTYYRAVVQASGCAIDYSDVAVVTVSTITVADAGLDQSVLCADNTTLSANAVGAGETGTWTVTQGSGVIADIHDPNTTVSGLAPGINEFTWTITDDNGLCPSSSDKVSIPFTDLAATVAPSDITCNGASDGSVTVTASGGAPGYEFSLDGATFQASNTFTGLDVGTYTITVKDANGCTITVSATINEPVALSASVVSTGAQCNGASEGTITVTAIGGTAPYQYSLDGLNFQVSNVFSGLSAGSYTITIEDANGCTVPVPVTISEPVALSASSVSTDTQCNGASDGTITITATGGTASYQYSLDGLIFQTSNIFNGLAAGNYTVTIEDANGCTTTVSATVNEPLAITANVAATDATCNGTSDGSVTVTASGGAPDYQYSLDGVSFQTSNVFSGLSAGTYTVTIEDANGCTITVPATINEPDALAASVVAADITCNGASDGTITVTATGGTASYQYSLDGATFQTSNTFTGLDVGTYTVTVKDANGCTTTVAAEINEPVALSAIAVASDAKCNGSLDGSVTVTASGGTTAYEYSLDGTTFQTSNTFTGLGAGTYTITIRDANGCTTTATATVSEPIALTATATTSSTQCNGSSDGSITVTASGGTAAYEYSLDGSTFQASNIFTGLAADTYTVTVRDANACTTTVAATVTEPPVLTATASTTDITCNGAGDGSITITASGGVPGYEYSLNGVSFQSSNTFTEFEAGIYTITIRDAKGCTTTVPAKIKEPAVLTATATATDITCNGAGDGSITVTASGGTVAYEYSLDGGPFQTSNTFSGLGEGTYTITVRDVNGCSTTAAAQVKEPDALMATAIASNAKCNGSTDGSITVTVSGGTEVYEYSLDGITFQFSNTFTGLGADTYTVTVRDANTCTTTASVQIKEPVALSATAVVSNVKCNGAEDGSIVLTASGGTPTYEYSMDGLAFQANNNFSGLDAGSYTFTIRDANGCTTTVPATITEPDTLAVTATTLPDCDGTGIGSIDVNVTGGTAVYNYVWTGPTAIGNVEDPTDLLAGTYSVKVTDANGCSFTLNGIDVLKGSEGGTLTPGTLEVCAGGNTDTLYLAGYNGEIVRWESSTDNFAADVQDIGNADSTSFIFNDLAQTTYYRAAIQAPGCSVVYSDVAVVNVNDLPVSDAGADLTACEGENITLDGSGSATGTNITYSWTGPGGFASSQQSPSINNITLAQSGTYALTVTNTTTGCISASQAEVTVNGLPAAIDQTVALCEGAGGSGSAIVDLTIQESGISGGATDVAISWYSDVSLATSVATPEAVTVSDGDVYYALVQGATCQDTAAVTYMVNGLPTAMDQTIVLCEDVGGSGSAMVNLTVQESAISGGATDVAISWYSDAGLATSVAAPAAVTVSDGDAYYALIQSATCQDTATVTYMVNSWPIALDQSEELCEDTPGSGVSAVDLTVQEPAITENATGVVIDWYSDASLSTAVAVPTAVTVSNGDIYYALVQDATCQDTAMVAYTVNSLLNPSVGITSDAVEICAGDEVEFTSVPVNGGSAPNYQWYVNSSPVFGETGSTFTTSALSDGDQVNVVMTAGGTLDVCNTGSLALSNIITISVPGNLTASVTISTDAVEICAGEEVRFEATPVHGGSTPTYQWYINTVMVAGETSPIFTTTALNDGDQVNVVMTAGGTGTSCVTGSPATSNIVEITFRSQTPEPTVNVTTYNYCPGEIIADLEATGTDLKWYDDEDLTNLVGTGSAFASGIDNSVAASYSFYVTQTLAGCGESDAVAIGININNTSPAPAVNNSLVEVCQNAPMPTLEATGNNLLWYADAALTNQIGNGTTYTPSASELDMTTAGSTTFWITQNIGCGESSPSTVEVVVTNASPAPGVVASIDVCQNTMAPNLSATGTALKWYSDPGLTAQIGTGSSYIPSSTELDLATPGSTLFYVTQDEGCGESPAATVTVNVLDSNDPACGSGGGTPTACGAFDWQFDDTPPSCGGDDGKVAFNNTTYNGTTPPIMYSIRKIGEAVYDDQPSAEFIGLSAGDYEYKVKNLDNNDVCTGTFVLRPETSVTASASAFEDVACYGEAVGRAKIDASGSATGDYYYSLDNGVSWSLFTPGNMIGGLPPNGTYNILVGEEEFDTCPALVEVTIENKYDAPVTLDVANLEITPTNCNESNGSITIYPDNISGGVAPYYVAIENDNIYQSLTSDGLVFEDLPKGTMDIKIKDSSNPDLSLVCEVIEEVTITSPNGVASIVDNISPPDCASRGTNGKISVAINIPLTTANPPYQFGISRQDNQDNVRFHDLNWNSDENTFYAEVDTLSQGTYYVFVISLASGDSCPDRKEVTISGGPTAVTYELEEMPIQCFGETGGVRLTNFTGVFGANYEYQLVDEEGESIKEGTITPDQALIGYSINALSRGDYILKVSQEQPGISCTVSAPPIRFAIAGPLEAIAYESKTLVSFPDRATGSIEISKVKGGKPDYSVRIINFEHKFPDQTDIFDETYVLEPSLDGIHYETTISDLYSGVYTLVITDGFGCEKEFKDTVDFDRSIFIPNVFTPNGDEFNPVFHIRNLPDGSALVIMNRWGKVVYQNDDYDNTWDGDDLGDGIYYYKLSTEEESFSGWVEIWRGSKP